MIHIKNVKSYCSNYEEIENYQEAVNSSEKYDCHHRLEETGLSKKDLIDMDMYYNRPASELIFLTHRYHRSLHHKGKVISDETKKKISKNHADLSGDKNPMYGKHHSTETKKKISKNHADFSGNKHPRYKHICPALLQMMYIEQKMSAYAIAKKFGVDRNVIRRRLRELNIPIRKR